MTCRIDYIDYINIVDCLFLEPPPPFPMKAKGGMSSWNGIWHELRNSIIKRNVIYTECESLSNKNRQKAILTGLPRGDFFLREGGGCAHSGHHITLSPTIA